MSAAASLPIRLGVDLGSMLFRCAYVYPDEERAVVSVPVSLGDFLPCFPISERLPVNDVYVSRFFPGLLQRLERGFELTLRGAPTTTPEIVADLLRRTVNAARNFSGHEVESLTLSIPLWTPLEARAVLREAVQAAGAPRGTLCTHADTAAAYFRAELMDRCRNGTVLLFSAGYTGLGLALTRMAARGHRVLALAADQGVLAGNCLDFAILQGAFQQLRQGRTLVSDQTEPLAWTAFQHRVEVAKHEVEEGAGVGFTIPEPLLPGAPREVGARLDGEVFRALVDRHLDKACAMIEDLLHEAGMAGEEIQQVLLEGGTTYLPGVGQRLKKLLPGAALRHLPPDALAAGAARLAAEPESGDCAENAAAAAPRPFFPAMQSPAGLVTFENPDQAGSPASVPPAHELEVPVDLLTLEQLRREAREGDLLSARRRLAGLLSEAEKTMAEFERLLPGESNGKRG